MIKTIVIDPGHGGGDSGALGPNGTRESDLVLSVGLMVKERLGDLGFKVLMTRDSDHFVGLKSRAGFANDVGADAFVSIHCNSAKNPAQGIETFIARQTAVSYPLAEALQESLTACFPERIDRGVKRANFTVLTQTKMAAALVELEFIHTEEGEEFVSNESNRRRYAKAVADGVAEFLGVIPAAPVVDPVEPGARVSMSIESRVAALEGAVFGMEGKQ